MLPLCCRSAAALLPLCCRSAAALLPLCCRSAAALLPLCRRSKRSAMIGPSSWVCQQKRSSVEALGLRVSVPRGFRTVRMPHVLVSTQIRLETGPTIVGDETSDPEIMTYLGARKTTMLGNNFAEYHVDDPPRVVLDKLEKIGFRVVTMTGVGQTLVWCLHRDAQ